METNSYSQIFGCLDQTQISLNTFTEKKKYEEKLIELEIAAKS